MGDVQGDLREGGGWRPGGLPVFHPHRLEGDLQVVSCAIRNLDYPATVSIVLEIWESRGLEGPIGSC